MHLRVLSLLALITLLGGAICAPVFAHPHAVRVAPADEYFGRFKMSILGVRNELRDLAARLQFAPQRGAELLGTASLVEDALHDWERKYPGDPWIPKSIYDLSQIYGGIHTFEGRRRAANAEAWLVRRYPATAFARTARAQMAANLK